MATIKPIESGTIHRIQSGQVIVDLCSVAKELIENSVDAGASIIDVRFKNQGLDSIEVEDNGSGISPDNFDSIALKHYTSKLSSYDDISNLQTFGFRGEALSSLCALSHLSLVTCQSADVPKGSRLKFAQSGALEDRAIVPAKQGTTVIVENLFHNLPVRRRELERHIKREWTKLIALLNQYACILTSVKFTVSQQPTKGKKIALFSTKGNATTRDNLINVFGAKTMTALIPLDVALTMEPSSTTSRPLSLRAVSKDDATTGHVTIKGHVSRPAHGEGRQAPDRQMFFVNGRPCGLPQVAKVFNEVYRAFNNSQSPFIFADIQLDTHMYDVNVSPDKRTIMLHEQGRMLENLRDALNELFEAQDYKLPAAQLGSQRPCAATQRLAIPSDASRTPGAASTSPSPLLRRHHATRGEMRSSSVASEERGVDHDIPESGKLSANKGSLAKSTSGSADTPNLLNKGVQRKPSCRSDESAEEPGLGEARSQREAENQEASPAVDDDMYTATPIRPTIQEDAPRRPVQDFHARLAEIDIELKSAKDVWERGSREHEEEADGETVSGDEHIHSSPPRKRHSRPPSPGPASKRSAPDPTTITVGSHGATTIVGTWTKRHRGEHTSPSLPDKSKSKLRRPASSAMPSFGGRLSQMFSATASKDTNPGALEADMGSVKAEQDLSGRDAEEISQGSVSSAASPGLFAETEVVEKPDTKGNELDFSKDEAGAAEVPLHEPPETAIQLAGEADSIANAMGEGEHPPARLKAVSMPPEPRQTSLMKGAKRKKDTTLQYEQSIRVSQGFLSASLSLWEASIARAASVGGCKTPTGKEVELGSDDAEDKLSLTISKGDFGKMKIVGQFNLGFILAVRPGGAGADDASSSRDDELFIIDQHASDEKYNFERLQTLTVVQSQRLVHPKTLDLTALEEEIVIENLSTLEANGFKVAVDESGDQPVGSRCQLLALPLSRETTFTLADLEELISLLGDGHTSSESGVAVPRPTKVRKMFAMRACRSSVMIGHALQQRQMERLVRHMGELDKPWNCPHGRPTMRHLTSLRPWDDQRWRGDNGSVLAGLRTTWDGYLGGRDGT